MSENSINAINKSLDNLYKRLQGLDRFASTLNNIAGGGTGTGRGGGGGGMPGNFLSSGLAQVTTVAQAKRNMITDVGVSAAMAGLGAAAGISSAMPDLRMTLARESAVYGAGVASGGFINRGALESTTRLGLGKFMNIEGATGVVSGILAGRGMVPGSRTYNQTVTAVGQAARYLNMPNDVAAQALEGLTSGPTSAMMMSSFGVFTSNPMTGQAMSQKEIFSQLAARWTGGRKTSLEGTMESLRRGALGSNIRNSGLDPAQQALLSQFMIDRANGIDMDLSDPNAISKAVDRNKELGYENPFLSGMELTSKNDQMMERATQPYIAGMKAATTELIKLKDSIMGLPDEFYKAKGAIDTFMGDFTGAGVTAAVVAGVTGMFNIITSIIAGLAGVGLAKTIATAVTGKVSPKPTSTAPRTSTRSPAAQAASDYKPGTSAKPGTNLLKTLGKTTAVSAVVTGVVNSTAESVNLGMNMANPEWVSSQKTAQQQTMQDPWGAISKTVGNMDVFDWLAPLFGAGGPASTVATGTSTVGKSVSGNGQPNLKAPVKAPITCKFGVRDKMHPNGHHGIDYGVPEGTSIGAAGDGVVASSSYDSALGNLVRIDHGGGYSTRYAHLSQSLVSPGMQVKQGMIIAKSGNTGTATTGPHLHFEVMKDGNRINPAPFIGGGGAVDLIAGALVSAVGSVLGESGANYVSGALVGFGTAISESLGLSAGDQASPLPSSYSGAAYVTKGASGSAIGMGRSNSGKKGTGTGGGSSYAPITQTMTSTGGTGGGASVINQSGGNTVNINLQIEKATVDEAKKFASLIKEYLEEDNLLQKMGSK